MKNQPYECNFSADIIYPKEQPRVGAVGCVVGTHINFDPEAMQSFVPDDWQPIIYDAMLVVAAVEVCDRSRARSKMDWARSFSVRIPVHDPQRWNAPQTKTALIAALQMLTGDNWSIDFRKTPKQQLGPAQRSLGFPRKADKIVPYSDGLDSRAVAGILEAQENDDILVRVRVGANRIKNTNPTHEPKPFENVPFSVTSVTSGNGESSGRSRGFKFGMLAGLAAYLINASDVIVPESGQGALGPVLAYVGQSHVDRRTHPQFTVLMSDLLEALFGTRISFVHPVIWNTKGQTLAKYRALHPENLIWNETRSCWMDQRLASADGGHRQCGICAACMLRRMSLHAAGYNERPDKYVWEDLGATDFRKGAHASFSNHNNSQWEYAIAGTLHMDHLAALKGLDNFEVIALRQAIPLSRIMGITVDEALKNITNVVGTHAREWAAFVGDLPKTSFIRKWAESV